MSETLNVLCMVVGRTSAVLQSIGQGRECMESVRSRRRGDRGEGSSIGTTYSSYLGVQEIFSRFQFLPQMVGILSLFTDLVLL